MPCWYVKQNSHIHKERVRSQLLMLNDENIMAHANSANVKYNVKQLLCHSYHVCLIHWRSSVLSCPRGRGLTTLIRCTANIWVFFSGNLRRRSTCSYEWPGGDPRMTHGWFMGEAPASVSKSRLYHGCLTGSPWNSHGLPTSGQPMAYGSPMSYEYHSWVTYGTHMCLEMAHDSAWLVHRS